MNQSRVAEALVTQAKRDAAESHRRQVAAKSELDRVYAVLGDVPELSLLVNELGSLHLAADPARGQTLDSAGRSADPPSEGDATAWARVGWVRARRRLVEFTNDVQSWMGTPPDERVLIDPLGKCVTCGRRRGSRVRVSRDGRET